MNTLNITNPLNAETQQNTDEFQEEMTASNVNATWETENVVTTTNEDKWVYCPFRYMHPNRQWLYNHIILGPPSSVRILLITSKVSNRIGTEREHMHLRKLLEKLEEDDTVLRMHQCGIVNEKWVLALELRPNDKLKTDEMRKEAFKNIHSKMESSGVLDGCFNIHGGPMWRFMVGNVVKQVGGLLTCRAPL